jgi:hypothetical protein
MNVPGELDEARGREDQKECVCNGVACQIPIYVGWPWLCAVVCCCVPGEPPRISQVKRLFPFRLQIILLLPKRV